MTESRVRNHSRVGHGQRTGGAEQRGRLASRCKDSVLTLALFRDQTKACRDLCLNYHFRYLSSRNFICIYRSLIGLYL